MNTTKKDQIDVPRVVPRTGTTGISIHRIGLPPLTRRVVPPCQRMSLRCPPLSPKSGWTPRKPRGFTSPCPSAMQMLRTSRGREKLPFTIGDNGLQPRGLHRTSIGHRRRQRPRCPVPPHGCSACSKGPASRTAQHGARPCEDRCGPRCWGPTTPKPALPPGMSESYLGRASRRSAEPGPLS
jgi:hypothetical protein